MIESSELLPLTRRALTAAETLVERARQAVMTATDGGKAEALERAQFAAHGLAWYATYAAGLRQMLGWAERLETSGHFGEIEQLILQAAFGEYLAQMAGGLAMSQGEIARPADLGIEDAAADFAGDPAAARLIREGNTDALRRRLSELMGEGGFGERALEDESLELVRDQFHRFAESHREAAHRWHREDVLIPLEVVEELAALGVFGLTVPEAYGGLGLGKLAMCVVTEELSRGYIGLGSLGTRSEIAAELASAAPRGRRTLAGRSGGWPDPPHRRLHRARHRLRSRQPEDAGRARGRFLSHHRQQDLDHPCGAQRCDDPARPHRSEAAGLSRLSMFIAEKPRGTAEDPFPAPGMSGGEIRVLGYRGMKEYELAFDGFEVKAANLLGEAEGEGFKQLMATFESARIQTAARATGVAQEALELGLAYAKGRVQFGKPIYDFPRVYGKLAWMAVETMIARQLTYHAARQKDSDKRCDIEAGQAKLLAARVAWANADNALQVHGGNGYAEEYAISRVLCDARILNIFEGATEIQAQVIARGLIAARN
jgi:(2S)-methylsuccinyl-CoA dehydrogenase